jgi:uncharacterized protein YprB with RNaseH-like and TPR domain
VSGESFAERLRRLRRENPAPPAPESAAERVPGPNPIADALGAEGSAADSAAGNAASADAPSAGVRERGAAAAELPAWLRTHLGRRPAAAQRQVPSSSPPPASSSQPLPPTSDGPPADLVVDACGVHARILRFAAEHRHGSSSLGDVATVDRPSLARLARDPRLVDLDPMRALYLDIETTGLSGGAGTWPFLVALGGFTPVGDFELWQGFLCGPEQEPALLRAVAERIAAAGQLVTFFGKSFDRHRLEDKMRLHGIDAPFARCLHLDLFHLCRQLHRESAADGRLATMERELCGVLRHDDLSGAHAPAAWFDFLARRPHRLERVFEHNRDDVLSLVVLAAHCGQAERGHDARGAPLAGDPLARARGLARAAAQAGDRAAELRFVEQALSRLPSGAAQREHRLWRATVLERLDRRDEAVHECLALAAQAADAVAAAALARAAKLQEHHCRDSAAALASVERALALAAQTLSGPPRAQLERYLERRRDRLSRRLRPPPADPGAVDG